MQKAVYLLLLVFTSMCWAQDSSFLAVIKVDYSSTSGKEDTQFSLDKERHIFFIESDNKEELLFYNAFLKENEESHSAGTIKSVKRIKNTKAQQVYSFEWNFENSFDAINGKAFVTLEIDESETSNKESKAKITITNEKDLQLVYKGIISYYVNPLLFYYRLEKVI
jgi:hypothetical protein